MELHSCSTEPIIEPTEVLMLDGNLLLTPSIVYGPAFLLRGELGDLAVIYISVHLSLALLCSWWET